MLPQLTIHKHIVIDVKTKGDRPIEVFLEMAIEN